MFFRASRKVNFFIFSQGCTRSWGRYAWYLLEFLWSCENIQFKPYATSKMELFVTKKVMTVTVVDFCYITLCLKCGRVPRSNSKSAKQKTKKDTGTTCQIYSKLTIKIPERRLVLLLLTLNIFTLLFCCCYWWIRANKSRFGLRNSSLRQ